ncbi:MAG: hypothetical protein ACRECT_05820 [Thermoplasmata archaeon]
MADLADGPPIVGLPERLDRRLRLGPFASARDALKFVSYAAAGAVLVPFTSPWLWPAVAAAGFGLTVVRPDGRGLDEEAASFCRWKWRRWAGGGTVTGPASGARVRRGLLPLSDGRHLAIVRAAGTPLAYLPPDELAARFERFRDLLRALRGPVGLLVASTPMRSAPVVPGPIDPERADGPAAAGYSELVTLLCRRRLVRRVDLVLATDGPGAGALSDLEGRVATLGAGLSALGLRICRLRDRRLEDAARSWGGPWTRSVP